MLTNLRSFICLTPSEVRAIDKLADGASDIYQKVWANIIKGEES